MKNILKYLLAVAPMAIMAGCEADYFNNEYLDGYVENNEIVDIQNLDYTLTDADYGTIAKNATNQKIAEEADLKDELKAISGLKAFTSKIDPKVYIPAFLSTKYDTYLSTGSMVKVTHKNLIEEPSKEVEKVNAATAYTLTEMDYKAAWEGQAIQVKCYTEKNPAEKHIPALLQKKMAAPAEGALAVVTYLQSDSEPSEEDNVDWGQSTPISSIQAPMESVSIQGTVIATNNNGFIVGDDTGAIYVHQYASANFAIGDIINVEGAVTTYAKGLQMSNKSALRYIDRNSAYTYPADAEVMNGETFDKYSEGIDGTSTFVPVKYVELTGKYVVSKSSDGKRTYHNFKVNGATKLDASFTGINTSLITPDMVSDDSQSKELTVKGYIYAENSTHVSFMPTEVVKINGTAVTSEFTPVYKVKQITAETPMKAKGQVAAVTLKSFILNDGTGSILVYDPTTLPKVGDFVEVDGTASVFYDFAQFSKGSNVTVKATEQEFSYPNPAVWSGMDINSQKPHLRYIQVSGVLTIDEAGPYYNVKIEGCEKTGSIKNVNSTFIDNALNNKNVVVTGYSVGFGKYFDIIMTDIREPEAAPASLSKAMTRAIAPVKQMGLYTFVNGAWEVADKDNCGVSAVAHHDFKQMGNKEYAFSEQNKPEEKLDIYLKGQYPYAVDGEKHVVAYTFDNGKELEFICKEYEYAAGNWTPAKNYTLVTTPFKKSGSGWIFDPNETIVLAPGDAEMSDKFLKPAVDFVYDNKNAAYTTYKGNRNKNSESFSGCSPMFKNLNWKISSTVPYSWKDAGVDIAPFQNYSSQDKAAKMASYKAFYAQIEQNFGEVMSHVLGQVYPDIKAIPGIDIVYTVKVKLYTEHIANTVTEVTHAFYFNVVGDGEFEYSHMEALDAKYELLNPDLF